MSLIIPDSPYETKRFTREEKIVIMSRKRGDYHSVEKRQIKWGQVFECLKDVKMWLFFLLGLTANIVSGHSAHRCSVRNCPARTDWYLARRLISSGTRWLREMRGGEQTCGKSKGAKSRKWRYGWIELTERATRSRIVLILVIVS